jgi:hypothetical protein
LTEDGVRASLTASVLKEAAPCSLTFGSPAFTVPTVTFHTLFVSCGHSDAYQRATSRLGRLRW